MMYLFHFYDTSLLAEYRGISHSPLPRAAARLARARPPRGTSGRSLRFTTSAKESAKITILWVTRMKLSRSYATSWSK